MATVATLDDYDGFDISQVDSNSLGMCILKLCSSVEDMSYHFEYENMG